MKGEAPLERELAIPEAVRAACALLGKHKHQVYVVGGGIRDLLLGVSPQDWDLATDARPAEVEKIFTRAGCQVVPTGVRFGTLTVFVRPDFPIEVTTLRVEGRYADFRHPERVRFVKGIAEDLARRDFTINAMAYDPLRRVFHDPYGGRSDLLRGVIRCVGKPEDRFREDPLRMLRAVRFAAELGFRLEEETFWGIVRCAELIRKVSAERIRDELNKILLASHFLRGLVTLKESHLLFLIIPELKDGWLFAQYHPSHQYTVLEHTFEALRYTPSSLEVRLAVLLHDVAKPRCFTRGEDKRGHFYGHEHLGAEAAERILRRLRYSTQTIRTVTVLVREHMIDLKMGPAGMRRLVARVGRSLIRSLLAVREADFLAHSTDLILSSLESFSAFKERLLKIIEEEKIFEMRDLAVSGADVLEVFGCRPGPVVGWALKELWNEVLNDPAKNERGYLLGRLRELAAERKKAREESCPQ